MSPTLTSRHSASHVHYYTVRGGMARPGSKQQRIRERVKKYGAHDFILVPVICKHMHERTWSDGSRHRAFLFDVGWQEFYDLLGNESSIYRTLLYVKTQDQDSQRRPSKSPAPATPGPAPSSAARGKQSIPTAASTFHPGVDNRHVLRVPANLDSQITRGLKLNLDTPLLPEKGAKAAVFNATYKQPAVDTRAALDFFKCPTFTTDDGFLGGEASCGVTEGQIKRYAAAFGYHYRISRDVEAGARAVYDTTAATDNINNAGVLVLSYTQLLRSGAKSTFGLVIDTQKSNNATAASAAHKIDAHFVFEG
ncbi:hypothetical protein BOTBODRAFT_44879 [Botryobasidium botryosum FD-172 SS1]|uniref:Uncharacterized protein n=1 Tax=Botryobasidium botryosum (strain FD-172 SS1) TaxID=930990 RepID=A0A067MGX3_BOTB1|nr:hypothetical protein BOTBODRAFT_44879 [Botryobasidium botryosum FD-172 SS1]